jgi:trans-2,3-dihydro-3-hydroxyanthranilate isomerase
VVHDADDIDDETMLAFARETRLSETTFVQTASVAGADYRNRIFWPNGELPFAGHPSLGTAVAVALARGEQHAHYVQQTPAGLQPIDVELLDDDAARASMLQGPALLGDEVDPQMVFAAAGLELADADPGLPPQVVSTGLLHLVAPVRDVATLARVHPTYAAVEALTEQTGGTVLYLAACDPAAGTARARGFFAGHHYLEEDPATGSAAGPLCAYLAARTGAAGVTIDQGVEMGRPSRLETRVEGDRIRVEGDVVVISDGSLFI